MARRAPESDEYVANTAIEARIRGEVAGQAGELIGGRDRIGSRGEFTQRLELIVAAERQVAQAQARHKQALTMGLPLTPSVNAEFEARVLLRQAVMEVAAAAGGWVVAMDFETGSRYRDHVDYMGGIDDGE